MKSETVKTPQEFADICPIADSEFNEKICWLVKEPGFKQVFQYMVPAFDYDEFASELVKMHTKREFQVYAMVKLLHYLCQRSTDGVSSRGLANVKKNIPNTYITNHRDIVLDSAFMNMCLDAGGFETSEVAIGDNLLIYDWINVLVRLNKSFIVKRNLGTRQVLEAAKQLSAYIHFAITEKKQSVWIAQRQGRSKDSTDNTQESLLKMLAIGGKGKSFIESLKEINLMPVTISYEYDPNDFLKAAEFLQKKRDPNFKKSQKDDLLSMDIGIRKYKGRIKFSFNPCINDELDKIPADTDKRELPAAVCKIIDKSLHANYEIYACNYVAYDWLNKTDRFADKYTAEEKANFENYINTQISKIRLELSDDDRAFVLDKMLTMYSNPLVNKLKALGK